MSKFKAIIYDLDNTIFPTHLIKMEMVSPVLQAIRDANDHRLSAEQLTNALTDCYRLSIREVAKKYNFSELMINAALSALSAIEINDQLTTYDDYRFLKEIEGFRFLVTSGDSNFQMSKINNLRIANDFNEIFIHDDNESGFKGKLRIFQHIQHKYGLNSNEVMVVGDSADNEIAAGNELKMTTVQILRSGITKASIAQYHIGNFSELFSLNLSI
ncbi:HAD family hydrolase [Mucilaginibacter lappiensis]|uniref:Hydrolase of the HAD superfamily n=1 Tax=Mucilaginibacter lappiensis TaxID=354630 RepID=A0A1N7G8Y9_9SPHI|nr:HAD family hydrolase [Mucilaginibacter lappiensis]MBB6112901.1 putative hydrolase of the HAD superfamily [Mucilaginibacter lappiensis]MBB6131148.1 putative hydrolase of the HAD superfamily [Mucilaginibacter lappiensis]SIS09037.1 haloacid dehalogenase superfamily, subfamily IA, variant 1 with third motif having Dx(3-4)D or Dx(3-4)E [Mucilaginibacter lappiensis]